MPEIETSRLCLQPITADKLGALAQLWSEAAVMRYLPSGKPHSVEATQTELNYMLEHWCQYGFGTWALRFKGQREFVGYCVLQYLHEEPSGVSAEVLRHVKEVELGYGLAKKYWGQRIASEAASAVLRYGFEVVKLPRVVAAIHKDNIVSQRILEGLGMKFQADMQYYGPCPHFAIAREAFQPKDSFYRVASNVLHAVDRVSLRLIATPW